MSGTMHVFARVTPGAEFPAAVERAIREGRAKARERGYTPVLVHLTPGAPAVLDQISVNRRRPDGLESVALDPAEAEAEFMLDADLLRGNGAVLVQIVGDSSPESASETLRVLRTEGPPVGKLLPYLGDRIRLGGGLGKVFGRDFGRGPKH